MTIDVERARAETPGCAHVTHLNNAGSALPPAAVVDAVVEYLRREAEIGGYEAADERRESWEHTYDALARLVGGARDEIAVVENATRAWDMAFYAFRFSPGDRILTGRAEYASNWIALQQVAARTGAVVEVVPDDEHGQFDVAALAALLDARVKLVSLVHAPAHSGLINPVAEVGRLTRAGRSAAAARRVPVGRAAADRRRGARLRRALRHGPQVPARPARDRLSLGSAEPDRGARAAAPRPARRRVAAGRRLPHSRRRPPVRELGDVLRGQDRPRGGCRLRAHDRARGDRGARAGARGDAPSEARRGRRASRSTTAASCSAPRSPSPSPAERRPR